MNQNETDKKLDALLAEMPVEPKEDFCDRVLAELKREERLDALLAEAPVEPSPDFVERTMEEIYKPSKVVRIFRFATNVVKFPPQVRRAAGLVATCAVIALAVSPLFWRELPTHFSGDEVAASKFPASEAGRFIATDAGQSLPDRSRLGVVSSADVASRVADTVRNDPELYALWAEDEASSFDDILAVSEIISAADLSTLELLATNDF